MNKIFRLLLLISLASWVTLIAVGCSGYTAHKSDAYETIPDEVLSKIDLSKGYAFGSSEAPITIIDYSSYECKDCADLHNNISEKITNYVDKGLLRYVYKPVDHPKFENDLEINLHFTPNSLSDIASVFERFDRYAHRDLATLENVLHLPPETSSYAFAVNQAVNEELGYLGISKTPTLIVNNREYTGVVFTGNEFDDLIRQMNANK